MFISFGNVTVNLYLHCMKIGIITCALGVLLLFKIDTKAVPYINVTAAADTLVTKQELKQAMYNAYLAKGPKLESVPKPVMEILDKSIEKDHERWHFRYLVDKDEYGYAYLLVPLNYKSKKLPMVLCAHPTSDIGKDRVVAKYDAKARTQQEQTQRDARQYGLDLVRRGFVVLAPDRAAYGERRLLKEGGVKAQMDAYQKFLDGKHKGWTLFGKAIWDMQRTLDAVEGLDFVDDKNIGIIGHSLGGWDAILLAAFDDRIKAAVMNSGGMINYKQELWTSQSALREYLNNPKKQYLNVDANIFIMLAAKKSMLFVYSLADEADRGQPVLAEGYRVVYNYLKKESPTGKPDMVLYTQSEGHDMPKPTKELEYKWLEIRLGLVSPMSEFKGKVVALHTQETMNDLNMTPEQRKQITKLTNDSFAQLSAIQKDQSLTNQEKKVKTYEVYKVREEGYNSVLTPEQLAKFKQLKEDALKN